MTDLGFPFRAFRGRVFQTGHPSPRSRHVANARVLAPHRIPPPQHACSLSVWIAFWAINIAANLKSQRDTAHRRGGRKLYHPKVMKTDPRQPGCPAYQLEGFSHAVAGMSREPRWGEGTSIDHHVATILGFRACDYRGREGTWQHDFLRCVAWRESKRNP